MQAFIPTGNKDTVLSFKAGQDKLSRNMNNVAKYDEIWYIYILNIQNSLKTDEILWNMMKY